MIHLGGSLRFFLTASSAISSILSREVFSIKFDVAAAYSRFGHLSPKTQPLTQATAQSTVFSTITFFLSRYQQQAGRCSGRICQETALSIHFTLLKDEQDVDRLRKTVIKSKQPI